MARGATTVPLGRVTKEESLGRLKLGGSKEAVERACSEWIGVLSCELFCDLVAILDTDMYFCKGNWVSGGFSKYGFC